MSSGLVDSTMNLAGDLELNKTDFFCFMASVFFFFLILTSVSFCRLAYGDLAGDSLSLR